MGTAGMFFPFGNGGDGNVVWPRRSAPGTMTTVAVGPTIAYNVGYIVGSVERTTAEMEAAGHPAIAGIHSFGVAGDGAAVDFDTGAAVGFLVEAVEPPSPMPPPDFTM